MLQIPLFDPGPRPGARWRVTVVDDDESVRESLPDLLCALGYEARAFSSAEEFLASDEIDKTDCLVLDIAMPGMSGLDLQQKLKDHQHKIPIIFITAQGTDDASRAVAGGAVACLLKPFADTALMKALKTALSR